MRTIRSGDRGDDVRDVQQRLVALGVHLDPAEIEGGFGHETESAVRAFQQRRGLLVDGRVGSETWNELVEAGYRLGDRVLYLRMPMLRGDDVRSLQRRLNSLGFDAGREDGIFGERCDRAVREFQRNIAMRQDGIVGPETLHELERVRPATVDARSGAVLRETEALRRMKATLEGARIAIDPGHGPDEPGAAGAEGLLAEADAAWDLSVALAAELDRRGAQPLLLRERDEDPPVSARAAAANEWGAEICLSVHLNAHTDPRAEGSMCLFYGNETTSSPSGQRLAEAIQEELTSRIGLTDGRTHSMSIAILRETRMPAVQIEPCFVTNPREERLLSEEPFRRDVAIAIARGVERFLGARPGAQGSPGLDDRASNGQARLPA
ncbi:MAG TPA: N-acetylmuramoyl-L-alanine amidase [Actinomycetota bacterium]|jgi:N-acetylmuramoyl-L-alanine amidase